MVIIMGSNYVFINLTVATIPPFTASSGRSLMAFVILFPLMIAMGQRPPPLIERNQETGAARLNRTWRYLVVLSTLAVALPFSLMSWGQQYVDASLAAIILAVMPLTTVAVAPLIVSSETWTLNKWAGFVLGFIGIGVLVGLDALKDLGGDAITILAQLALLLAAVCYGVGAVFVQRLGRVDPIAASTIQNAIASIILLPFAIVLDQPWTLNPSTTSIISFILTGVFATGFASVGFFMLVRMAGATFMALTSYVSPLWAVIFAMIVLGERPGVSAFAALVLILVGLGFTQARPGAITELFSRRA